MKAILKYHSRTHKHDMAKTLGWMSVRQSVVYKVLLFIWDVNSRDENSVFKSNVQKNNDIHPYNTRGANKFHMPSQKNRAGQNSLFINGLNLFTKLPENMKTSLYRKTSNQCYITMLWQVCHFCNVSIKILSSRPLLIKHQYHQIYIIVARGCRCCLALYC
jgi:hypothetical protein